MSQSIPAAWSEVLSDRAFRRQLLVTVPVLCAALAGLAHLLVFVEDRPGVLLPDPVLDHLTPVNLTWLTFGMIYLAVAVALISLAHHPRMLLVALQSYALMAIVRMAMMAMMPLEAPAGLIPLADPVVQLFGTGRVPTKDLFFSGHTSTLFLLFLTARGRPLRWLFLCCVLTVAVAVLWQHVHYTIDVLVAPFVAYGCYRVVTVMHQREHLRLLDFRKSKAMSRGAGAALVVALLGSGVVAQGSVSPTPPFHASAQTPGVLHGPAA